MRMRHFLLFNFILSTTLIFCQVTDIDGNTYSTEKFGKKLWMIENLRVTRFNNGDSISLVMDNKKWVNLNYPGYCYFDDKRDSIKTYGLLYNGFVVEKNVCPNGWHIPNEKEWQDLLKEIKKRNLFTKYKLQGHRRGFQGQFYLFETNQLLDGTGPWWCLSDSKEIGWNRFIDYVNISYQNKSYRENGLSCRCIKD
jgi:uncharacterized protein (TIGR02145 family)